MDQTAVVHRHESQRQLPARTSIRPGAKASAPCVSFEWLRCLPRAERQRLRRCSSPRSAREVLARAFGVELLQNSPPRASGALARGAAPAGLVDDLRRHAQLAQRQVVDLEHALQKQAAEHEAEIEALMEENRKTCRHAKLQLLAQIAPDKSLQRQVLSLVAPPSDLGLSTSLPPDASEIQYANSSPAKLSFLGDGVPQSSSSVSCSGGEGGRRAREHAHIALNRRFMH